jgi:hypothetical protein
MKLPNEKQIMAMNNLRNNISFGVLIEWIEDSMRVQNISNNHLSGENAIKGQGRGLELEELLKHFNNSEIYANNLKK